MRDFIVSSGTGLEKSSYSLQYSQDRLQRRMGMMCARMGWSVERSPLVMTRSSRMRRLAMSRRRRWEDFVIAFSNFYYNISDSAAGTDVASSGEICRASGSSLHSNRHQAAGKLFYVEQFLTS